MAIQLGSAYGKVSLDTKGLIDGVKKSKDSLADLESAGKRLGEGMKNVGKTLTASLTLPIAALSIQATKLASDMVETEAKVKVVFGNMTEYVMDWSQDSAHSMQLSRQEALEAAATFGNLFVAMKIGSQQSAEMSTTLVQLAGDLGSINNIDPSVVLAKLKSGIVGETEAVRDLGIDLRATVVEAKAAAMGFKEVNGQFAQGDLIAARYAIILEQTAVAQGDIARTGGELAGQMRTLNAQWKDALAALGKNLLPIVLKFVTFLNQMLEKFNNLTPKQQKFVGMIILMVAAIGPLLLVLGTLLTTMKFATHSINPFSGGIFGLIGGFVKLVSAAAVVVTVLEFFGVTTGAVGAAILGLNAALVGLAASVASVILPILLIIGAIVLLYIAWKKNLFGIQDIVKQSIAGWKLMFARFGEWWKENTKQAGENVHATFAGMGTRIQESFRRAIDWIKTAWTNFMNFLRNLPTTVINYIVRAFQSINWGTLGRNILMGIANGMLGWLPSLLAIVIRVAQSVLTQIKKSLGISSPSREAMKLGAFTAQGYALGIQNAMNPDAIARSLAKPITNNSSNQQTIQMNFANGVTIQQVRGMVAENGEQMMNSIIGALGGA